MNKPLVGMAVAIVVLVVAISLRGTKEEGTSRLGTMSGNQAARQGKASSDVVLSIAPGAARREAPRLQNRASALVREMRTASTFRPIFDRLRARSDLNPEERYVLAMLLEACANIPERKVARVPFDEKAAKARFAAALPPGVPDREKRLAAFDKAMGNRCGDFAEVNATKREIDELYKASAEAGEPKAQAQVLLGEIRDARRDAKGEVDTNKTVSITDDQIERWKRIVASGDPRAMLDVILLFNWNADMHLRSPDETAIDGTLLYQAATLVACDLGYPCGPDSPQLASACVFQGKCDSADYRDHLFFYVLAPGDSQRAMQYQAELQRVIQGGDWSFFSFHRGPSPINAAFPG